jgi:hypothetical protein
MANAPMQILNGLLVRKADRNAGTADYDLTPRYNRHYVAASGALDVQLHNGLRWGVGSGKRLNYVGSGYLTVAQPLWPGQTRGDQAGFRKRGPDPLSVAAMWNAGPGSQPANPGGPGRIAGQYLVNPMTG